MKIEKLNGAILINKPQGLSSFGVIEELKFTLRKTYGLRNRDLPKIGHGGTLDPFATGVLVVLIGKGVKLARYFLGSDKKYRGVIRFGETTLPGDPTAEISEKTDSLPVSVEALRRMATTLTLQPYLQTPPMFSAKKHKGKPLYKLAREGQEVSREQKACYLKSFTIEDFDGVRSHFNLHCTSGTYVRTLAQDFGRMMGSLGMLDSLERTAAGSFSLDRTSSLSEVITATEKQVPWDELNNWIPFDFLLDSFERVEATPQEAQHLIQGRQNALFNVLSRSNQLLPQEGVETVAIFEHNRLLAVARHESKKWSIDRVFVN